MHETAAAGPAGHAAPAHRTPEAGDGAAAVYVHGIVDAGEISEEELTATGIARAPLELVQAGRVAAVISRVSLNEFGETELREQLEDLAWLEDMAREHERVLEEIGEQATVVPMRLCTVYEGDDSLRRVLLRQQPFLVEALARLTGRTEWGVKVFAMGSPPPSEEPAQDAAGDDGADTGGAGAAYMRRRRQETAHVERSADVLHAICERIHARLAAAAVDDVLNRPQPPELVEHEGEMVLNGAYLVSDDEHARFATAVAELQQEHGDDGIELELTGPWPPYNFVGDAIEVRG